ncbi:hypothetical protein [Nocardia acidivorans]|uniref:hypothetical protein n=1 Tax=Nocardia acidivorans TaxID=404580 RepID=UPI00082CEA9B|nr:hypothetical protein [Nocardia acidivorans]
MSGPEIPPLTVAAAANRAGTVTVHATDQGMPVDIHFERGEYRYGAQALADEILRLTKRSAIAARARRRELLAEAGVPEQALDRLGLPTRQASVDALDRLDEADTGPANWLRNA